NGVGVRLSSARGTVVDALAPPAVLAPAAPGSSRFNATLDDTNGAVGEVVIRHKGTQPIYHVRLTANGVSLVNGDTPMTLTLTINGADVSQSVDFRLLDNSFVFP